MESFLSTEAKDKDLDREASCYKPRRVPCEAKATFEIKD